jgi:hypothetical protein
MVEAGQLTTDGSGRYYPDTDTRTGTTPEVSHLSDCPVTSSDQPERPGHPKGALSDLSDLPPTGDQGRN